ncbi:MAG: hypothetical protein CMJ94_04455 [Planctomycetes bacterium]|nr:hypothetical protein [Planctomycetota bacterium]
MNKILPLMALGALTAPTWAQQTALSEDFDAGVVPPAGWTELNNGVTNGWEPDLSLEEAEHDDYFSGVYNDNRLESPAMDLSTFAEAYLHCDQDQVFPSFRDINNVDVTLDGGATYTTLYSETGTTSVTDAPLEVDLSAYAGLTGVQLSFHYTGDYANAWRLDNILVDDMAPPPPPPYWSNMPSTFESANGFRENFEALAGVTPSYMGLNALDATTRLPHPDAWCNIGGDAACLDPYDGMYALEMGGLPGNTNYPVTNSGMILGLNGAGVTDFTMSFQCVNHGEEFNAEDGVFVSSDGDTWEQVVGDWAALTGVVGERVLVTCDLASTSVDVSGDFYVLFSQYDNFPYADLDGVGIDNIVVGSPVLAASNLVSGSAANLDATGCDPAGILILAYSLNPGPTATPYGTADIGSPYKEIGRFSPDASGNVSISVNLPPSTAGLTAWVQGLEISGLGARFTNGLKVDIQ